jgi:hypothetical protein
VPFLVKDNPLLQILVYTVPFVFIGFVGVFIGVVFKRWGPVGMYVMWIGSVLVIGGLAVIATWQSWWPAIGRFFINQSTFSLFAGYPLALTVLAAGAGYLAIRRATP